MLLRKNLLVLSCFMMLNVVMTFSANKIRCSTVEVFNRQAAENPDLLIQRDQLKKDIRQWIAVNANSPDNKLAAPTIITIPVVVHVVWHANAENISDAQIVSQITALNKDYRNLNADKLPSSHPFYSIAGDAGIEFCLAKLDPSGNPTTGITRTNTSVSGFTDDDKVKKASKGGINPWDATKYLNLWVCKLTGDLLGYAQFPGGSLNTDGVVIGYSNFGTTGQATAPYDYGRTATHEIGHWLNLTHIWGDDEQESNTCSGSDDIADTPNQQYPTYGCPTGVQLDSCATVYPGYMYENYMDYTDDPCMVMFSKGQITAMRAAITVSRSDLLTSNKCSGTTGISLQTEEKLRIYPNPVRNYLTIEGLPKSKAQSFTVDIFDVIGKKVYSTILPSNEIQMEMPDLRMGTYVLTIYNDEFSATQKLSVVK